ncbi:uncharacterized protein LOC106642097 [Copidosoma floridanum]|uniref:uncharacterized protein LOC106642097 n=1 Tax=Copidosoma floridanum TaxID=29053 RepID=UPI000C6FB513|nr:uncharacterized protein LOC106642097 [Copidosoma floridanum]
MNATVRFVTGTRKWDHITPDYKRLRMLPYPLRVDYLTLTSLATILQTGQPEYLTNRFEFRSCDRPGTKRATDVDLIVPRARLDYLRNSFFAIHAVTLKDSVNCTLRVCELILKFIGLLLEIGILKQWKYGGKGKKTEPSDSRDRMNQKFDSTSKYLQNENYKISLYTLLMDCVVKITSHLGCSYCSGCLESIRGPQADFCRSQIQIILSKLQKVSSKQFSNFFRQMVRERSVTSWVDFFHCYVGFCRDSCYLQSPLNQKRGSSKFSDATTQSYYATNFGLGLIGSIAHTNNSAIGRTSHCSTNSACQETNTVISHVTTTNERHTNVESQIIECVFKTIVTRCVEMSTNLKSQNTVSLYCDLRQFINYVKEAHGSIFRRVALSCLLDSATKPNSKSAYEIRSTRIIRHLYPLDVIKEGNQRIDRQDRIDDKEVQKCGFKKRSTSSTCALSELALPMAGWAVGLQKALVVGQAQALNVESAIWRVKIA